MKRIATGIALAALMFAPAFARAEDKSTTTTTGQTKASSNDTQGNAANPMNTPDTQKSASATASADEKMTDARLVTLLQKVNKEEIQAGKLAQKRGKSAAIRDFGKTLITDHTKSEKEVAAAAKKAQVKPGDSALTTKDKEQEKVDKNKMAQLKKLNGAAFDHTFAQVMKNDHEHMISLLKDHKDDLKSDDLKKLVDDTIPVLEQHKDLADKAMSPQSASAGSNQGRSGPGMKRSPNAADTSMSQSGSSSSTSSSTSPQTSPDKK